MIGKDQMRTITESVWSTVLGLPLEDSGEAPTSAEMTGSIQISGAWVGSLAIRCSSKFADLAARAMFDLGEAPASEEEARDALGELANIVGGNLKGMLPGPSLLSLPTVVEGSDYVVSVRGVEQVCELLLTCEGEPLSFKVFFRGDEEVKVAS